MNLDLSALKYFGKYHSSNNVPSFNGTNFSINSKNLIEQHSEKTDEILNQYRKQFNSGEMSASDYKFAKLDATADDIIYYLGVKSNQHERKV